MKFKKIKSKTARTIAFSSRAVIVVLSLGIVLSKTIETDSQNLEATRVSASNEKTNYKKSTEIVIVDYLH